MFSSVFSWATGKLQPYLAVAGALIVALGYAFVRGNAAGAKSTMDTINQQTLKLDKKFREIDTQRPDFDRSVGNLRKRATK